MATRRLGTRLNKKAIRLRWAMTIYLQTHTPQETAEWVRDELRISPDQVREWLIKPALKSFKKSGRGARGHFGVPFPKKVAA